MRFNDLPFKLRAFILGQALLLAPVAWAVWQGAQPDNWLVVGGLLLLTVAFSIWKVDLIFQGKMTPLFVVQCLSLLLEGPQAALCSTILGALVGSTLQTGARGKGLRWLSWRPYKIFFNVTNCTLACGTAALAYGGLVPDRFSFSLSGVLGLAVFTACYFLINTASVSLAIATQQRSSVLAVWKENFLWTAPGLLASACAAAGVHAVFQWIGPGSLLIVPPLHFVYHGYQLHMERLHLYEEKERQHKAHIEELSGLNSALSHLNEAIIASLATAIDAKDRYTSSHINRVQVYAMALGRAAGVEGPQLQAISTGALVHDIGKLGIPDHILGKPGKLTPEEFQRIQSHVTIGAEILSPVPFPFPVVEVVMTHHERWDGFGYPSGMRGEEIPIGGRIISIVDVFDALTSDRPYRRAMTFAEALGVLNEGAGKQFDPKLVALFESVLPAARADIDRMEAARHEEAEEPGARSEQDSALARIGQTTAEMAALYDVAHSLAEQESVEGVVRVVLDRALSLVPADSVVLYMQQSGQADLLAAGAVGKYHDKLRGMTIQVGEGVAGWVASHQKPLVNVSAALDVARRFDPQETIELSAATAVPLLHGQETQAVLAVYTTGYSVLSAHHLEVLNILAEHAAGAIQNLRRVERNQELAFTDSITGVANSRFLVRHLERLTHPDQAGESVFSIVMLDLDRFKEVNDQLGHMRGDDLLRVVAERLMSVARPTDVVCRYAGDEFVLLLPEAGREQAERVAERVREAIDAIPPLDDDLRITASIGVASAPEDASDGRSVIHVADMRMYEDKAARRGASRGRSAAHAASVAGL